MFSSCEKNYPETLEMSDQLYGFWVENGYKDDILIFRKADQFNADKYGFQLFIDGKFIEHKNSGWCGTPPISYSVYEGVWLKVTDSLLDVQSDYWGGTMNFQMEIETLNENELLVRYIYQN